MNSKQFTAMVVVVAIGGIIGGYMSDRLALKGQAFANGVENSIDREEMDPVMDIRDNFDKSQQVGTQNRKIAELISNKILPEKEYETLLETARNEVQGMGLDELREKIASLQAVNICLINYLGKKLYYHEKKQKRLDGP